LPSPSAPFGLKPSLLSGTASRSESRRADGPKSRGPTRSLEPWPRSSGTRPPASSPPHGKPEDGTATAPKSVPSTPGPSPPGKRVQRAICPSGKRAGFFHARQDSCPTQTPFVAAPQQRSPLPRMEGAVPPLSVALRVADGCPTGLLPALTAQRRFGLSRRNLQARSDLAPVAARASPGQPGAYPKLTAAP
jgi:hypothetical protein